MLKTLTQRNCLADLVEQQNIVSCIYVSKRQGNIAVPLTTLEQCLLAIIAAVWLDSQKNCERVRQMLSHVG